MPLLTSNDADGDQDMAFDFHFPASKKALIIFSRNPELGKCKTRLAATIGDENALELYKFLLKHTAEFSAKVNADRYVFYSEDIQKQDLWDPNTFRKKLQTGSDLGQRMKNAFTELFEMGYQKVIIVGSDIYTLSTQDVEHAYSILENSDLVIGPAEDGGYYLLGMKCLHPEIFENKNWGTSTVLSDTLATLQNKKVSTLETKNDIDIYEDIKDDDVFRKFIPSIISDKQLQ